MLSRFTALLSILALVTFVVAPLHPKVLPVPQQFRSVQTAISAARTGDTVLVSPGTYYENLLITRNITLASRFIFEDDSSALRTTIIDGSRAVNKRKASVITISGQTDTTCRIIGLTIRGGTGSYEAFPGDILTPYWIVGGGILVRMAGVRIAHNIITGNSLRPVDSIMHTSGAGIACFDQPLVPGIPPAVVIEDNLVIDNSVWGTFAETAGIAVQAPGVVRRNIVLRNVASARTRSPGGGIGLYLSKSYRLIAEGNYVRSNHAGIGGGFLVGAVAPMRGQAVIRNNIIVENTALEVGGAIHVAENANALIAHNTMVSNSSQSHRDGVSSTSSSVAVLVNNIIWGTGRSDELFWSNIRPVHTLTNERMLGYRTFHADPMFVPGDTMYHLLPESPAIGTAAAAVKVGGQPVVLPAMDYAGRQRTRQNGAVLGAHAVDGPPSAAALSILEEWGRTRNEHLKLTWVHRQVGPAVLSPDSSQIVHAGSMSTILYVNDTVPYSMERNEPALTVYLPPGHNLLEVEVIARGLNEHKRIGGHFLIEGIDQSGIQVPRGREYGYRSYSGLPPGTYTLISYAVDESGFIDRHHKRTARLIVSPFWYQEWWATALLVVSVILLLTYVYSREMFRLRRSRELQRAFSQHQIESQELERKRLASELHDGLGQDLLVVNNELQQFLAEHPSPPEELQRVSALVRDSIEEVREISSALHPHIIERLGFCAAVEAMVHKLSHSAPPAIGCRCDSVDDLLPVKARIHLFRIIQESLTNIKKHAQASHAQLEVRRTSEGIDVTITDNGRGFVPAPANPMPLRSSGGLGLSSLTERARIIGAEISITSEPKQGTVIRLHLPAGAS